MNIAETEIVCRYYECGQPASHILTPHSALCYIEPNCFICDDCILRLYRQSIDIRYLYFGFIGCEICKLRFSTPREFYVFTPI